MPGVMDMRDRIKQRLEAVGLTANAASKLATSKNGKSGNPNLIGDILRNPDQSPRWATIEKIAQVLETTPEWLANGGPEVAPSTPMMIPIRGMVEAGAFREVDIYASEIEPRYVPGLAAANDGYDYFALEVRGPSINRYCAEGGFIVCVPVSQVVPADTPLAPLLDGKYVVVERVKPDGSRETTVKRFVAKRSGPAELHPDSTHPAHQAPITYDDQSETQVSVIGVVRYKIEMAP